MTVSKDYVSRSATWCRNGKYERGKNSYLTFLLRNLQSIPCQSPTCKATLGAWPLTSSANMAAMQSMASDGRGIRHSSQTSESWLCRVEMSWVNRFPSFDVLFDVVVVITFKEVIDLVWFSNIFLQLIPDTTETKLRISWSWKARVDPDVMHSLWTDWCSHFGTSTQLKPVFRCWPRQAPLARER